MTDAAAYEQAIAEQAQEIWQDETQLSAALFRQLYPLLCKPIHEDYIVTTEAVTGKPYVSTGIKSVQVQIDRLNNVLTPLCWWEDVSYQHDGKLCHVTVSVGDPPRRLITDIDGQPISRDNAMFLSAPLVSRSSYGGVDRGSTTGNVYKGSYTNAAKLAIARLGCGHEIYIGSADLDPDVNAEAAAAGAPVQAEALPKQIAQKLVDHAWDAGEKERLRLAASRLANRDIGDCATKAKAVKAVQSLSYEQAERLDTWLSDQLGKKEG